MEEVPETSSWKAGEWSWDPQALTAKPASGSRPARRGARGAKPPVAADPDAGKGILTTGKACCQVDGCTTELTNARDYHSRYKICETHLKASVVLRDSRAQRFCQQCGKFQDVEEFDDGKRSCRARLEKHNARRRRQREMQQMLRKTGRVDEELLMQKYGLTEEELAPKIQRLATTACVGAAATPATTGTPASAVKAERAEASSQPSRKRASPSPAMSAGPAASAGEPAASASPTTPGSSGGGSPTMAADALAALANRTHGFGLGAQGRQAGGLGSGGGSGSGVPQSGGTMLTPEASAMLAADTNAMMAHAPPHGPQGDSATGVSTRPAAGAAQAVAIKEEAKVAMTGINLGATDLNLLNDDFLDEVWNPDDLDASHAADMARATEGAATQFLQLDPGSVMDLDDMAVLDELSTELITSTLGAVRAGAAAASAVGVGMGASAAPTASAGVAIPGLPPMLGVASHGGGTVQVPQSALFGRPMGALGVAPGVAGVPGAWGMAAHPPASCMELSSGSSSDHSSAGVLDEALNLLAYDHSQVTYISDETLLRFSAKLFNCTPAQLPPDLKVSLVNMLSCNSIEGYIRPGCVHLTVDALMGSEERAQVVTQDVRSVVERLVSQQPEDFWRQHTMLLQLEDKMCLVRGGKVVHVLATGAGTKRLPHLAHVRPLVATPTVEAGEVELALWGFNLGQEGDVVLARCQGQYLAAEAVSVDADPSWRGQQRLVVRVAGAAEGALRVEVMRGSYVSASKTVLVAADGQLAAELRGLEAEASATDVDALLGQLGGLVALAAATAAGEEVGEDERAVCGRAARRLLPYVLQRGWLSATQLVLRCLAADINAGEAMAQADVMAAGSTGMPVLQLAVRAQRVELVRALLEWGAARGHAFNATTPGRRGLTALHLAALLADGGEIAGVLTRACPDALAGWDSARCEDGSTPMAFAEARGSRAAVERAIAAAQFGRISLPPASSKVIPRNTKAPKPGLSDAPVAVALAAIASSSAASLAASSSKLQQQLANRADECTQQYGFTHEEDEERDEVAAEKAAARASAWAARAQGPLLVFRDPGLEAQYCSWFNAGQVPVDLAFMVIAILSQGAWIWRWSSDCSALALSMLVLMLLNGIMMQVAMLYPTAYSSRRQALCLASHAAHKLAQLLVTVLPLRGTVYSPTFNPTVALLESSGFAQAHMLSLGVKLRFQAHLVASAFHLATALLANRPICASAFPGLPSAACVAVLGLWQLGACALLPSALVYAAERRSRRVFLDSLAAGGAAT